MPLSRPLGLWERALLGAVASRRMAMVQHTPNPIQAVIREQLGVDAFALDGDDTEVADAWLDRKRTIAPRAR